MENKDQPSMPFTPSRPHDDQSANGYSGLTKREYFAGLAIQGVIAIYEHVNFQPSFVAQKAVQIADALLKELDNNP